MSNPGVIALSTLSTSIFRKLYLTLKRKNIRRFQIEDNVGESIHIHIDDIRLDLSITDFLKFSDNIQEVYFKYLNEIDPGLKNFDPAFLSRMATHIPYVKSIKIVERKVSDLRIIEYENLRFGLYKVKLISRSIAVKYLQGDKKFFESYIQYGDTGTSNQMRLSLINDSIKKNGYPYLDQYIVIFKGQNIIRDGQHRAAVLLHNQHKELPIIEVEFQDGYTDHLISTGIIHQIAKRTIVKLFLFLLKIKSIVNFVSINLR